MILETPGFRRAFNKLEDEEQSRIAEALAVLPTLFGRQTMNPLDSLFPGRENTPMNSDLPLCPLPLTLSQ